MNNYQEFKSFINEVKENNIINIKNEISNMILMLDGNKIKIYEAIDYARQNSDFDYEMHIDKKNPYTSIEDVFNFEKGELINNFSKERLDYVIELYKKYNINFKKENKYSDTTNNNKIQRNIIIAGVIIATSAYFLYKIFK